jgi:hypothetical protein
MSAYTPPPGNAVPLDFVGGPYTPPAGNAVPLEFRRGAPPGENQFVFPLGWASSDVGPVLVTGTLVTPGGWLSSHVSTPAVANTARAIAAPGIAPPPQSGPNSARQIPDPWVSFRVRYLVPGGIAVPTNQIATTHVVAFETQFIDLAGRGPNPWVTGNARVEFAVRYIEPPFIASNIFGAHNVARIQVAAPTGWESSFISENHELDINLQRVFHHSGEVDPTGYGATHIRNQFEVLHPTGWLSQNINFPVIYNLDQYLFVQPYMGTNSDPTQWPNFYPFVENKTRMLGPGGWVSSRFSVIGNIVENTAAPLLPPGLDATLWGLETFIAHRIRHVGPEGWDSFYNTQYAVVYNGAAVLAPQGWASSHLGVPTQVLNLNRTVLQHSGWEGPLFGAPFIAFAVRTVYPGLFYDVPSGFPEVRHNPYPITPAGIDSYRTGGHAVAEHFNVVSAKPANVHPNPLVGEPIVENRNKTLSVFPSDQSLYGLAKVFNYNTHLTVTAGDLSSWGAHFVGYRTRNVVVVTISAPVFSVTHQVRNVLPDPPARQLVEPNGIYIGLEARPGIIPSPTFNYMQVSPPGIPPGMLGTAALTENSIRPGSIIDLAQVGTPIFLFTQYLYPEAVPWPRAGYEGPDGSIGESDLFAHAAKPRVSPHTIYAPAADQATAQAIANHPSSNPHAIDTYVFSGGNHFGRHEVSNYHREIGPVPTHGGAPHSSRFGTPELVLRLRYVYPSPIRSLRSGLPVFLGVPQFITFEWYGGWLSEIFGTHAVAHPPVLDMPSPAGFVATTWGTHRVELFNREVAPNGIPHRGNPQQGLTNPWGNPLVGYPRTYVLGGFIATLWGTHRVEHRIRQVYPAGWDSYADTLYELSGWSDRMRVRRTNPPGGVPGIPPATEFGIHLISFSIRTIFGRGISGYNSGDHIVKTASTILPAGWDSLEVGDIDRWEAGKIKPHGDDLSIMGTPRMLSPLRPSGPSDGVVGAPRVGVPLYPLGIPEIGFAGPSVSNPFGCTNRVVTPLPILSQQNVPQPAVT